MAIEKVLITGAAGSIGAVLRSGLAGHYQLRLSDIASLGEAGGGEQHDGAELSDLAIRVDDLTGITDDRILALAGDHNIAARA